MRHLPRTHARPRPRPESADRESDLRDRMLMALTDKNVILKVAEATHGASSWSTSAASSSGRELQEGLDLIDVEKARLSDRLQSERQRRSRLPGGIQLAACDASIERLLCRLEELADHREQRVLVNHSWPEDSRRSRS